MEIDFMGLSSTTKSKYEYDNQHNFSSAAAAADIFGGVETSLSLSTTPSHSYNNRGLLHFSEMKKKYSSRVHVQRPVFRPSTPAGFPYSLNSKSAGLRNMSVIKGEPVSSTMIYSGCAPDKAENSAYTPPHRLCNKTCYTPTVAMARRATLARFLEKRLHRMNQATTAHLMGKPSNATNDSHDKIVTDARSNNQRNIIFRG